MLRISRTGSIMGRDESDVRVRVDDVELEDAKGSGEILVRE